MAKQKNVVVVERLFVGFKIHHLTHSLHRIKPPFSVVVVEGGEDRKDVEDEHGPTRTVETAAIHCVITVHDGVVAVARAAAGRLNVDNTVNGC